MQARITADDLAKDVTGAEALISRHRENKTEIDSRVKDITRFTQKGKALIADKNFMASEVCTTVFLPPPNLLVPTYTHQLLFRLPLFKFGSNSDHYCRKRSVCIEQFLFVKQ